MYFYLLTLAAMPFMLSSPPSGVFVFMAEKEAMLAYPDSLRVPFVSR
jgi:hypothetical protein